MSGRLPILGRREPRIPTPCISLCRIDPFDGLCQGCHRTIDEITRWSRMSQEERTEIMASLDARKQERAP